MHLKAILSSFILTTSTISLAYADTTPKTWPGKKWLEDNVFLAPFDLWVGVRAVTSPRYTGSDRYRYYLRPIVETEGSKRRPFIADSIAGGGVKLFDYYGAYLGGTLFWRDGWKAEDELKGLNERRSGLEASAVLGYENFRGFDAKLIASWGLTGDVKGLLVTAKMEQDFQLTPWWRITPGAYISWGSEEYMNNYFGISPEESLHSLHHLAAYKADAGFKESRLYISNMFQINDDVRLYLDGYANFALKEAKESPLIKDIGTDINYGGSAGLSFRF
ncbi:MAG: MipA/OmpV family protein [Alphaproteobacteria bacterium]